MIVLSQISVFQPVIHRFLTIFILLPQESAKGEIKKPVGRSLTFTTWKDAPPLENFEFMYQKIFKPTVLNKWYFSNFTATQVSP